MTLKYCRICQKDTPHTHGGLACINCNEKQNKITLESLESLELIDRIRRLEKITEKITFGI